MGRAPQALQAYSLVLRAIVMLYARWFGAGMSRYQHPSATSTCSVLGRQAAACSETMPYHLLSLAIVVSCGLSMPYGHFLEGAQVMR